MRGAIHSLVINNRGVGTPDAEGRHGAVTVSSTTVVGRMMLKTGHEATPTAVGRFAEDIYAVASVPYGTVIAAKDQVVAQGIDPTIDGTYEVEYVMYTPMLYELYLRLMDE